MMTASYIDTVDQSNILLQALSLLEKGGSGQVKILNKWDVDLPKLS
jgi:hypothetical protein